MAANDSTFLGRVRRVDGATVFAELSADISASNPIVHGRVYRIGQVGSFVRIPLGFLNVYGVVSMVGVAGIQIENAESEAVSRLPERTLQIRLVGEAYRAGRFERGVSTFPTIDDEVHVVTEADLQVIYAPSGSAPITIGRHAASESLPATLDLDKLVTRHAAILGSTGSGKSNTVAALMRAITSGKFPQARLLVIDPHGEYAAAFQGISRVFRIGDPKYPFFLPYWCLSFDELGWFLVDRRSASESLQDGLLRDHLFSERQKSAARVKVGAGQSKLKADEVTVDSPLPFSIRDLWYHFDRLERVTYTDSSRTVESLVKEGSAANLVSAKFNPPGLGSAAPFKPQAPQIMGAYTNKILQKLKDGRFDFLLNPGPYDGTGTDLSDLVESWVSHEHPITVFDLAGVPPEIIDLVVGLLSRVLFETMFWGRNVPGVGRSRPILMIFEEAHRYLPKGGGTFIQGYARTSVQRILKEGRKYGIGAVVVSQRPSELDETILSQCGTFIALRLSNAGDQGQVKGTVPDELVGLTSLLPALRTGEAIISGEATLIPSRVRIQLIEPRPDSGDPDVSKLWGSSSRVDGDYAKAVTAWRKQLIE